MRIVREAGRGTAGEVADGKAGIAIAALGGSVPLAPGLVAGGFLEEPYALVHAAGHVAPRSLSLVDWAENCGSYTRGWWAAQDGIPKATVEAEDDGAVLSLVSGGHGMAIMPALSLAGAPNSVEINLRHRSLFLDGSFGAGVRSGPVLVVAGAGDAQDPADPLHAEGGAVLGDEVPATGAYFTSRVKQAAARRRIARSRCRSFSGFRSRAFFARNRAGSSAGLPPASRSSGSAS